MQSLLERGQLLDGLHPAGLQLVALPDQSLPFVVGGAGVLAEPAELFVDRRDRGIGFVERGQRLLGGVLTGRLLGQRTGQCGAQLAGLLLGGGQFVAGLLHLGGDLERAGFAVRAAADPACPDQVAVGGDGPQLRARGHQIQRRGQIAHHRDAGQHRRERAAQPRRHVDQIRRPQRTFGRRSGRLAAPSTGQSPSTIAARPPSDAFNAATAELAAPKFSAATASAAAPSTTAIAAS